MLYSKNGSIPYPAKDDTDGWIEVEDKPVAPEGKEVVWWFPPGWVVRDPMPVKEGFKYSWSQSEGKWIEHEVLQLSTEQVLNLQTVQMDSLTSNQIAQLTSAQISQLTTASVSALTTEQISALTGGV